MIDSNLTKYIKELAITNSIKEILFESEKPIFKKIIQVKPKKTLAIKYFIAQTDDKPHFQRWGSFIFPNYLEITKKHFFRLEKDIFLVPLSHFITRKNER